MKAFHNDQAIKDKYLARVKAHALADEIIKSAIEENILTAFGISKSLVASIIRGELWV